ncbi:hypothetical protein [Methylobacterium sp. NFXW15]|uniref:hypothetical protein n=1 Tax=Methylobacterium sp. NFXW15 TaxID=2819512 RepID=UPI003CEA2417
MYRLPILAAALFMNLGAIAEAAPDSNCVKRFVGVWRHSGGGTSNIATLTADGAATCSGNIGCQQGTWSCQGNVMNYVNSSGSWNYTLISSNKMVLPGVGATMDRVGETSAEAQSSVVDRILSGRTRTNAGREDAVAPPIPAQSNRRAHTETNANSPSLDQSIKDGDVYMRLGRKAAKSHSIKSLREAAQHFRGAAEFYASASDPDRQREAIKAADQADAEAERQAEARKPARKTRANAADCALMNKTINAIRARTNYNDPDEVNKANEVEQLAAMKGCFAN